MSSSAPHINPDHYWAEKASSFIASHLFAAEMAKILEISERTIEIWFQGQYNFENSMVYGPVIREYFARGNEISWFGFIHAYLLKQLAADQANRQDLQKIAEFFQKLEHHYDFYCPLGTQQAWDITEFPTLLRFQAETDLPAQYCLITQTENGQLTRTPAAQEVYQRIEWEGGWARQLILQYPPEPEDAPIYMTPFAGSGFPRIRETSIVFLRNRVADWKWGDAEYMVGALDDTGLTVSDVERAVDYALEHNIDNDPPWTGDAVQRFDEYDAMLAEQKAQQETKQDPVLEPKPTEEKVLQPT